MHLVQPDGCAVHVHESCGTVYMKFFVSDTTGNVHLGYEDTTHAILAPVGTTDLTLTPASVDFLHQLRRGVV
jgi:hypothetical protein